MAKERCRSVRILEQTSGATIDSSPAATGEAEAESRRDVMSVAKRSALMSRIRGRDTGPEKSMRAILEEMGLEFSEQDRSLPGRPDFVLADRRVVVLVDGDFWHGWRFDEWKGKLSSRWRAKIASNVRRDARNRRALRDAGWTVIRVWEHQLERPPAHVRRRLRASLHRAAAKSGLARITGPATGDS